MPIHPNSTTTTTDTQPPLPMAVSYPNPHSIPATYSPNDTTSRLAATHDDRNNEQQLRLPPHRRRTSCPDSAEHIPVDSRYRIQALRLCVNRIHPSSAGGLHRTLVSCEQNQSVSTHVMNSAILCETVGTYFLCLLQGDISGTAEPRDGSWAPLLRHAAMSGRAGYTICWTRMVWVG